LKGRLFSPFEEDDLMIKIGAAAPDFTLKDQDGNTVTLSVLKGKKVVLSFHPLAWTSVCQE
jgi:peroxiredoxin